jgi:hypothetical protein
MTPEQSVLTSRRFAIVMAGIAVTNFLPGGTAVAAVAAPLACSAGVRAGRLRYRPDRTGVWKLLGAATSMFGLAGAVAVLYGMVSGGTLPPVSIVDGFYVSSYAVLAVAILAIVVSRCPRKEPGQGLDTAILLIAVGVAALELLIEPLWYTPRGGSGSRRWPIRSWI